MNRALHIGAVEVPKGLYLCYRDIEYGRKATDALRNMITKDIHRKDIETLINDIQSEQAKIIALCDETELKIKARLGQLTRDYAPLKALIADIQFHANQELHTAKERATADVDFSKLVLQQITAWKGTTDENGILRSFKLDGVAAIAATAVEISLAIWALNNGTRVRQLENEKATRPPPPPNYDFLMPLTDETGKDYVTRITNLVKLRGITWGHSRGFVPLVATGQRFTELHPGVEVQWDKRSLQAFADQSVQALSQEYDLLVIDHPSIGEAQAKGLFLPLDQHLSADFLNDQSQHAVGASHASYQYAGHQWALAIDAATPAWNRSATTSSVWSCKWRKASPANQKPWDTKNSF